MPRKLVCESTVMNRKRYQEVLGSLEETVGLQYLPLWGIKDCVLMDENVSAHWSLLLKQQLLKL